MSEGNKLRICYLTDIPIRLKNSRMILEAMEAGNIICKDEKGFTTKDAEYRFINCLKAKEYLGIYADQAIIDYRDPMREIAKIITASSCVPDENRIIDDRAIRTSDSPI